MTVELDIELPGPPVRVLPVVSAAADTLLLNGPCTFHGWSLRDASGNAGAGTAPIATGNAAAGGNGSALLPAGFSLTQFTLSFGVVATANSLAVTVTNAQGGTLTYSVALAVGQNSPFVASFASPLQAAGAAQITVTVTGNINSPAVTITAYGITPAESTVVEIQDGNNPVAEIALPVNNVDTRWYGRDGLHIRNRLNLHVISGTVTGAIYAKFDKNTG